MEPADKSNETKKPVAKEETALDRVLDGVLKGTISPRESPNQIANREKWKEILKKADFNKH